MAKRTKQPAGKAGKRLPDDLIDLYRNLRRMQDRYEDAKAAAKEARADLETAQGAVNGRLAAYIDGSPLFDADQADEGGEEAAE